MVWPRGPFGSDSCQHRSGVLLRLRAYRSVRSQHGRAARDLRKHGERDSTTRTALERLVYMYSVEGD